jgi:hypothetical protein
MCLQCGCECFDEDTGDDFAKQISDESARESASEAFGLSTDIVEKEESVYETAQAVEASMDGVEAPTEPPSAPATTTPTPVPSSAPTAAPTQNEGVAEFGDGDS